MNTITSDEEVRRTLRTTYLDVLHLWCNVICVLDVCVTMSLRDTLSCHLKQMLDKYDFLNISQTKKSCLILSLSSHLNFINITKTYGV